MARILLLEDNADYRRLLAGFLEAAEHSVIQAGDLATAEAVVREGPAPDLAMLDFWIGRDTALDLVPRLAAAWPGLPVIFISGGDGRLSLETAAALTQMSGAIGFLVKPFDRATALAEVDRVLSGNA